MIQFAKDNVKEIRVFLVHLGYLFLMPLQDQRRVFERNLDRYEAALQRFVSISKTKEASSIREVIFLLLFHLSLHFTGCFSTVWCPQIVRSNFNGLYVKVSQVQIRNWQADFEPSTFYILTVKILIFKFTDSLDSIMSFYQNAAEVHKGLAPRISELKQSLKEAFI